VKKIFRKKSKETDESKSEKVKAEKTSIVDSDYNRKKLFKKGINFMADDKLEDAVDVFHQALRIDPYSVETLMKLGYARFHLGDHNEAIKVYDKILDIDVTNPEAWNLKGLVYYQQKKYAKALDAEEKAIESDIWNGLVQQSLFLIITKSSTRIIRIIETFN
jgi:tetratricopeptide (TPR) repeat protein